MGLRIRDIRGVINMFSAYYRGRPIYLVGGTIRDLLLGITPKDFDFFVKGNGADFAKVFALETGGRYILLEEEMDEARVVLDDLIFDFNGGKEIFSNLARRDFTINSMAVRLPSSRVIDPFGGRRDLRRGIVRAISDKNISEDPLRVIRAYRFKSLYDFSIDRKTLFSMSKYRYRLREVAKERVKTEFFYMLEGKKSWRTLRDMADMLVLDEIIPGFSRLRGVAQNKPYGDLVDHSLNTVRALEEFDLDRLPSPQIFKDYLKVHKPVLKMACLLHDIGKPPTYQIEGDRVHFYGHEKFGVDIVKEGFRLSNEEKNILSKLIGLHMRPHLLASDPNYTRRAVVRLVSSCGEDTPGLVLLSLADASASAGVYLDGLNRVVEDVVRVMTQKEEMKERLITGDDLIELGLTPGPIFKKILSMVEEERTLGNILTKADAISYIKERWL